MPVVPSTPHVGQGDMGRAYTGLLRQINDRLDRALARALALLHRPQEQPHPACDTDARKCNQVNSCVASQRQPSRLPADDGQ